jgi:hypothetical protein
LQQQRAGLSTLDRSGLLLKGERVGAHHTADLPNFPPLAATWLPCLQREDARRVGQHLKQPHATCVSSSLALASLAGSVGLKQSEHRHKASLHGARGQRGSNQQKSFKHNQRSTPASKNVAVIKSLRLWTGQHPASPRTLRGGRSSSAAPSPLITGWTRPGRV